MLTESFMGDLGKNVWELKTQKMLTNVNHCFTIANVTPLYATSKHKLIHIPERLSMFLGLSSSFKQSKLSIYPLMVPYPLAVLL